MNDSPLFSTLREMRGEFARPLQWAALVGVAVVLTLAGAFGTQGVMRLLPLTVYWICVVVVTYAAGRLVHGLMMARLSGWARGARVAATGFATGCAVTLCVLAINGAVFGAFLDDAAEVLRFVLTVVAVSMVVSALLDMSFASPAPAPAPPRLLSRLPFDKRAPILALSVEDHYVRVRTTKGEEMLLMRLGDAMAEVGATPGAQVHRSHWVAWGAVASVRRDGDRAILTLTDGHSLPVSRANLPKLRERGLL